MSQFVRVMAFSMDRQSQPGPLWEPTPSSAFVALVARHVSSFAFWLNDSQSQPGPLWEPTPSSAFVA